MKRDQVRIEETWQDSPLGFGSTRIILSLTKCINGEVIEAENVPAASRSTARQRLFKLARSKGYEVVQ